MRIEIVIALAAAGAGIIAAIVHRVLKVRPRRPEGFWNYLGYEQPERYSEVFLPKFMADPETRRFNRVTQISFFLGLLLSLAVVLIVMYLLGVEIVVPAPGHANV
jgi:hypothetical protein